MNRWNVQRAAELIFRPCAFQSIDFLIGVCGEAREVGVGLIGGFLTVG